MKLRIMIYVMFLVGGLIGITQSHAAQTMVKANPNDISILQQDTLPLLGTFRWTFYLGPIKQTSIHTFASKYIDYQMRGKVHSTDYRMEQLSYDRVQNKWIGKSEDGSIYALFFKEITPNQLAIYKHKCKNGLDEAIALPRPADDTTADHGWNVYTRDGIAEDSDSLTFGGVFYNQHNQSFDFHDDKATWRNVTYQKLSHHSGERRWVGQHNGSYLVIFYAYQARASQGKFALITVDNIEQAYKLKYRQQTYSTYHKK